LSRNSFAIVLPARFGSTRFPGKPLARIAGRPLIEWVYERAQQVRGAEKIVVATDDGRIADAVKGFGGEVVTTSSGHETGTDRVAEVARSIDVDFVVNLQGDEPVFEPSMVEAMIDRLADSPGVDIVTACHPITSGGELNDPNIVKVVMDREARALYFSRSPVPHGAGIGVEGTPAFRHVGVYAFRKEALLRFSGLPRTALEKSERLEQLRALEHGMKIGLVITEKPTMGVDVPEDVKKVEKEITRT
jgi:3-deoxy-manno-octulosonate cytidylyltransferase (CMP-KDO synthetase)